MIKLRRLEEKDIPFMLEWMHDPAINKFFRFNGSEMDERQVRNFMANSFTEKHRHYAVVDETDEYLGTVSLEEIDLQNKRAMFALSMRAKTHGNGMSGEATDALMRIAFEELDLNRVYSNILAENERCCGFCEKNGFHYEGCFRRHLIINGVVHDWKWYSMLKEEYYDRRNRS